MKARIVGDVEYQRFDGDDVDELVTGSYSFDPEGKKRKGKKGKKAPFGFALPKVKKKKGKR